jgi:hypothetical protein
MHTLYKNTLVIFLMSIFITACGNNGDSTAPTANNKEQMDSMVEALETAANMDSILANHGGANEMPDSMLNGEMEEDTMYNNQTIDVQAH